MFVVGSLGAVLMVRGSLGLLRSEGAVREEALALTERLHATEVEAARWRGEARELLRGLGAALDRQFERWALSAAEKQVALLLKGLSHEEIADVRSIAEATARQQAREVYYRKAGLSGRNELAAFFLEDLLLPGQESDARTPSSRRCRRARCRAPGSR